MDFMSFSRISAEKGPRFGKDFAKLCFVNEKSCCFFFGDLFGDEISLERENFKVRIASKQFIW